MRDPIPNRLSGPAPVPNTLSERSSEVGPGLPAELVAEPQSPPADLVSIHLETSEASRADLAVGASLFLSLPDGWLPGIAPEVEPYLQSDEEIGAAYDATKTHHRYIPTVLLLDHGQLEPGDEALLDTQELVFREGKASEPGMVDAIERVSLPAGDALRVELAALGDLTDVRQVQYYIVTSEGYFALWFSCASEDLPACSADFEAIARSLIP